MIQEEIIEFRKQDKGRDFEWISQQFEAGNLTIEGKLLTKELFEEFRLFIRCTEEVYKGSWDIELMQSDALGCIDVSKVIIHFPDIIINNSKSESHKIEDLFVRINLDVGRNLRIRFLEGGRSTISYEEYCSGFFHSHVPGFFGTNTSSTNNPFYSSFCRGSGHINDFIADINSLGPSEERFISFLIQITGLVSWESLEGGPHRRINTIRSRIHSGRESHPSRSRALHLLRTVITYCKENSIAPDLDFKLERGLYKITDNHKLDKFLEETLPLPENLKRAVVVTLGEDGKYYEFGEAPGLIEIRDLSRIDKYVFQGREIPFVVGRPPNEEERTVKYFIHPEIKKYIINKIEYDINNEKIRQSTINKYSNKSDSTK